MSKGVTAFRRLVVVGLATGIGFALLAVAGWHFGLHRPVGSGPAGPIVDRAVFEKLRVSQPVLFVGLGDSVTAGFGARKGYSYFDRLVANPPDEFADLKGLCLSAVVKQLRVTNLALSGSTSLNHLKTELARLTVQPSNVLGIVVITTGGNDIIHNYGKTAPQEGAMYGAALAQAEPWIGNFERRLEQMLSGIEERFPGGCHVFLANIYDPTDALGDAEKAGLPRWSDGLAIIDRYNEIIARCAQRRANVHLVDIRAEFLGHGIHCTQCWRKHYRSDDPHYWYHENLEDPNERGYDALRRLFLRSMAQAFSGAPLTSRP
jgi:lysophospholipase L1-like esterase